MNSSDCVKGFPGILKLMISLEDYESFLTIVSPSGVRNQKQVHSVVRAAVIP